MIANPAARVLLVDDDEGVLEMLEETIRELHPDFEVVTAQDGKEGIHALQTGPPFQTIVSDLRMPGMDGITFLRRARELDRDPVRMLLTGNGDYETAIAAVNEGSVFRFLTKPCPAELLVKALDAAVDQHRLVTAERVLLEQTLRGSIQALANVLALAQPAAFGRAGRVKEFVAELLEELDVEQRWPVEVAAMLSQIGAAALPPETVERVYHGRSLGERERKMLERMPETADSILANIPRLESVREILRQSGARFRRRPDGSPHPEAERIPLGARILKVASDFATLEGSAPDAASAIARLCSRADEYDPEILEKFVARRQSQASDGVVEMPLCDVRVGMILEGDVCTTRGQTIVSQGLEVTQSLLDRLENFSQNVGVREPLRVRRPRHRHLG